MVVACLVVAASRFPCTHLPRVIAVLPLSDNYLPARTGAGVQTQKLRFGAKDPISLQHSVYDIVLDPVTELDDISRFIFELQLRSPQMRYQPELTLTASAEGAILAPH